MIHFKTAVLLTFIAFSFFSVKSQTTYYLDFTNGKDSNTGTDINTPIKTIDKLNTIALKAGDSVLFKRGEWWRNQLKPQSGDENAVVYYGAYGAGDLPIISTSLNMNKGTDWTEESENIWLCSTTFPTDVGNIIFNNEHHTGLKKWFLEELKAQDDYHYDKKSQELRIFSTQNPAGIYDEIECALRYHIVEFSNASYATIENLAIKYGAAHGFGGSDASYVTIRNCEISWIGGGDLNMDTSFIRFGNAIEFWCTADNNLVENNKIWEIFDTGVTNQCHEGSVQQNITYRNNVIWNCGMAALEIWNRKSSSKTINILFEHNTCAFMGKGWSTEQRADNLATGFAEFTNESETDNIRIQNNIFFKPERFFYVYKSKQLIEDMFLDNNCYYPKSQSDTFIVNYETHELYIAEQFETYQNNANDEKNSFIKDPQFINATDYDFNVSENSPCINTASNSQLLLDHDDNKRPVAGKSDIGAYENQEAITAIKKNSSFAIFPTVCNDFLYIKNISRNKSYLIKIYDVKGDVIYADTNPTDKINVSDFKTGVYFIEILSGDEIEKKVWIKE